MKQTCRQCGREFELTDGEIKFYRDKNLSLPKRCADCRNANKKESNNSTANKPSGKKSKKGIGAIAAAAVVAIGLWGGHGIHQTEPAPTDNTPAVVQQADTEELPVLDGTALDASDDQSVSQAADSTAAVQEENAPAAQETVYHFRNKKTLESHFEKHGSEFNGLYKTAAEYEAGASAAANSPDALHKLEAEDGDDVYYIESTNEFVIVSKDGYIRTYFKPNAGINYYNRQ